MNAVNNQAWVNNMNAWLQQLGLNTQINLDAIRTQAKALGIDPADIDEPGSHVALSSGSQHDDGDIRDPSDTSSAHSDPGSSTPSPYTLSPTTSSDTTNNSGGQGPANGKYDKLIDEAADKYHVSAALIKSVIQQESGGDPNAVNATSGCVGLMQLTPAYFGQDGADLKDPATNIDRGTKELARLLALKGGDNVAALAAYNLGENADIDSTVPGQNGLTGREYATQVLARFQ